MKKLLIIMVAIILIGIATSSYLIKKNDCDSRGYCKNGMCVDFAYRPITPFDSKIVKYIPYPKCER